MESMSEHFDKEAQKHDKNFINSMGMTEFYNEIEKQLEKCPVKNNVLVLGCGTGLEIERIKFMANVVAVDISENMIKELLKKKLSDSITLHTVCGSFLDLEFDDNHYDIVLTCYAMHHFNEKQKKVIYNKICNCLSENGAFINGDTMEKTKEDEIRQLEEAERIYNEAKLPFGSLHVDIPFCYEHELEILKTAGFKNVVLEKSWERTKLYRATR